MRTFYSCRVPFARLSLLLAVALAARTRVQADYPKLAPASAFPEYKIYDETGRPWREAREDWVGAQRRVKNDPAWSKWVGEQRAELERWMSKPRDRVEWAAGWSHDGVSPKDASRLIWTDAVPGQQVQAFHTPSDPNVPITPKTFAWWVVGLRGRNLDNMVTAARLYRLTGDEAPARWAASEMDFYSDNLLKWKPARDGARLFWQTLTEASNLVKFTETVRLLGDYVDAKRRARWRDQFFVPEVAVLNRSYQNIHNIACWQRAAAAQVALLFRDEAMWREAIDGPHGVRAQLREGVTSDYLWHEQSFGYNSFVVHALETLFVAAGLSGRAGELGDEMAIAENLMLSTTYYRFPDGKLPNPADNNGIGKAPDVQTMASMYRVFPTEPGLRAAQGERDWDTLLDPPPPAPAPVAPPAVVSRNLETTRMAILRQGPWQLFFHYGQLTRSHSESEALNFSAAYGTTDVTHDAGTAGYGSPMHRGYFTRGLAHNDLLVDGEGQDLGVFDERREWVVEQPNHGAPTRGELLAYSSDPALVSAAQPNYRKNAKARRTLSIDGNVLTDTAVVETVDGKRHQLGLSLHVQGAVALSPDFKDDASFSQNRPEPFTFWRKVRRAEFHDRAEFDVNYGAVTLHVTIACPGNFIVWHGSSPDVPPTRRESVYVETTGESATFTTTFSPAK